MRFCCADDASGTAFGEAIGEGAPAEVRSPVRMPNSRTRTAVLYLFFLSLCSAVKTLVFCAVVCPEAEGGYVLRIELGVGARIEETFGLV